MNTNAKKWVEALRSGKYKQGKWLLHEKDTYCCLGVACEVAIESGVVLEVTTTPDGTAVRYNGLSQKLPIAVRNWLGLNTSSGYFNMMQDGGINLAILNDTGKTFPEIADIIESEPEGLFTKCQT